MSFDVLDEEPGGSGMTSAEILALCESLTLDDIRVLRSDLGFLAQRKAAILRADREAHCQHPHAKWHDEHDKRIWYCPDCNKSETDWHTRRG